ncbi:MAG: DNA-3-methyladenine glycosylase I [Chloroflexi bacterium HGW-Chloroflexi-3]|nr:MAG: DNA-3-methyladenine glycosylase I [Chloroflexi bacterium HGW-Chloroflexi-3]
MMRCPWALSELSSSYHDHEWGVPVHDDKILFEFLILEGAQAGLNWETILKKRAAYRDAYMKFEPAQIAKFDSVQVENLLRNPGIIRNRRKIESAIKNANVFLKIQAEFGSFDEYIWDFVDRKPIQNRFLGLSEIPAETDLSRQISKDLKQRGMSFVGPTIMYAFMQAVGMVNDHLVECYRFLEVSQME